MDYPMLSIGERDRRWQRLRDLMAVQSLDAVIVVGIKGREHFEGYVANEYIEGVAILPRASAPVLLTWHPKMVIRRMGAKTDRARFWIDDVRIGKMAPMSSPFWTSAAWRAGASAWSGSRCPSRAVPRASCLIRCGGRCSTACRGRALPT